MANQFRITNYNVTASGIVLTVEFKSDTDTEEIPNSAENIIFPTGSNEDDIFEDLQVKAQAKVAIYQNDLVVKSGIEPKMNKWISVSEIKEKKPETEKEEPV